MSLLLDALKKAAQEKQKASAGQDDGQGQSDSQRDDSSSDKAEAGYAASNTNTTDSSDNDLELSLNEDSTELNQPSTGIQADQELSIEPDPVELELELEKTPATTSTVSDEALQLLVYKTNKQHRRTQKKIWGSIIFGAFFILVVGGVSYYYAMLEDVEALERKHKLAMRVVQSQPVTRPHILQSMQDEITAAKEVDVRKTPEKAVEKVTATQSKAAPQVQKKQPAFTIQKTEKRDPVSVLLNRAWQAYAVQDYSTAEKAYAEVLRREPNNRDALLGDAAIAVKSSNYERARAAYKLLLRLDPRDPIATAGLSSLDEAAPDSLGESKLKFMLQQQPDAAHLHFALGNLYAKQKKWPQAQEEYFNAWQGDSENADYAFNLAISLDQIGKYREARRFYESSLVLSTGKNINFSVDAVRKRLDQLVAR